jgi:hypothetical protein
MKRPDFIAQGVYDETPSFYGIFSKWEIEIWPNYWQISVTQHSKFNLKNQYTSMWAPLVRPNGGHEVAQKFRREFELRFCGLVVGVPGCRYRGSDSIPGATGFSE